MNEVTTFLDLFKFQTPGHSLFQASSNSFMTAFNGVINENGMSSWESGQIISATPLRILIGLGVYSKIELSWMHELARVYQTGDYCDTIHIDVFDFAACNSIEEMQLYFPSFELRNISVGTPIVGLWKFAVLDCVQGGYLGRMLVSNIFDLDEELILKNGQFTFSE